MCSCIGIKIIAAGALLVINDQAWLWNTLSEWLLVGIILIILGALKAVYPQCPVHGSKASVKKKGK